MSAQVVGCRSQQRSTTTAIRDFSAASCSPNSDEQVKEETKNERMIMEKLQGEGHPTAEKSTGPPILRKANMAAKKII